VINRTAWGDPAPSAQAGREPADAVKRSPADRRDRDGPVLRCPPPQSGAPPASLALESFEPRYPGLEDWVVDYFAPTFGRPLTSAVHWCAQWWDHAEAISRLEALWRSWEVSRLDELRGMAVWHRDFLDTLLPVLLNPTGPFARCTADRHTPSEVLPTLPTPNGYWDVEETGG